VNHVVQISISEDGDAYYAATAPSPSPSDATQVRNVQSSSIPTIPCKIDRCMQEIPIRKALIRQHLLTAHGYQAYHHHVSVDCRWEDCRCKSNCGDRAPGHCAHVEDITEHVWNIHLSFYEVCSHCGEARWTLPFARRRHEAKCQGPRPARCKNCLIEFPSVVALEVHRMWLECVPIA
jgi:hypothetical protein